MYKKIQIKNSDYEKASKLLSRLIDADSDVAEQINNLIQRQGIVRFFRNFEKQELSTDVLVKLQAVRDMLFGLEIAGDGSLRGGGAKNA